MVVAPDEVDVMPDRPYLRVEFNEPATLECCYSTKVKPLNFEWFKRVQAYNITTDPEMVNYTDRVTKEQQNEHELFCGLLRFKSVEVNDTGLYQCKLNKSSVLTHGTFLQVHSECLCVFSGGMGPV